MSAHAFFVVFELLRRRCAAFGHWNSVDDGEANASAHVVLQMTTAAAAEPTAIDRRLGRHRRCLGMFVMVRKEGKVKVYGARSPLKVVSFFLDIPLDTDPPVPSSVRVSC